MNLRHQLPAALGAAVILAGSGGAAAFALSAANGDAGADVGNTQPIDDNHPSISPTAAAAEDHGVDAVDVDAPSAVVPRVASVPKAESTATSERTEPVPPAAAVPQEAGDDHGTDAAAVEPAQTHAPEAGDDRGSDDGAPEVQPSTAAAHDDSHQGGGGGEGGSGSGSGSNDGGGHGSDR